MLDESKTEPTTKSLELYQKKKKPKSLEGGGR